MNSETIVMCVVALILGMLMANMLKSVCGCGVVEGSEYSSIIDDYKKRFGGESKKVCPEIMKMIELYGTCPEQRLCNYYQNKLETYTSLHSHYMCFNKTLRDWCDGNNQKWETVKDKYNFDGYCCPDGTTWKNYDCVTE